MKKEFQDYLESIDIQTETMLGIVDRHLDNMLRLTGEETVEIIVEDYYDGETRVYSDLTMYSDSFIACVANFRSEAALFILPIETPLDWVRVDMKDYKAGEAAEATSRLEISYKRGETITGVYKAAGANCDHLMRIYERYMFPNLRAA